MLDSASETFSDIERITALVEMPSTASPIVAKETQKSYGDLFFWESKTLFYGSDDAVMHVASKTCRTTTFKQHLQQPP